jgi:hypothetical protein
MRVTNLLHGPLVQRVPDTCSCSRALSAHSRRFATARHRVRSPSSRWAAWSGVLFCQYGSRYNNPLGRGKHSAANHVCPSGKRITNGAVALVPAIVPECRRDSAGFLFRVRKRRLFEGAGRGRPAAQTTCRFAVSLTAGGLPRCSSTEAPLALLIAVTACSQ